MNTIPTQAIELFENRLTIRMIVYICTVFRLIIVKKYIKIIFILACGLISPGAIGAQERLNIDLYSRVDYNYVSGTDASTGELSGFSGRYLIVRADGDLGNGFSYNLSQRLNKINKSTRTFDSTDWIELNYRTPDGNWDFTGGKTVHWVGAYEYDDNPIEVPFFSQYTSHCNPYLLGAIIGRKITCNDRLAFICTESPYDTPDSNHLGYSLEWRGHHGLWHPIYTAGIYEQDYFGPAFQLAFGNLFEWGKFEVKYDYMQRFTADRDTWNHCDFTSALMCRYSLTDNLTIFGKATCDINDNIINFDRTVGCGTRSRMYGAGLEYFPDKKHNIKFYAFALRSVGQFESKENDFTRVSFGIKWKADMLTIKNN